MSNTWLIAFAADDKPIGNPVRSLFATASPLEVDALFQELPAAVRIEAVRGRSDVVEVWTREEVKA